MKINLATLVLIFTFISAFHISAQKTAEISNVTTEYNCKSNGNYGIRIHINFSVKGASGERVRCIAFFYDEELNNIYTNYSGYKTKSGAACTYRYGNVTYNSSKWEDFELFMPYDALNMKPFKRQYYFDVFIVDKDNYTLAKSERYGFVGCGSNKRHVKYDDGTYADITYNSDGSITTTTYNKCTICHGRKKCNICSGAGGRYSGFGSYSRYTLCTSCQGDGKCRYCYGTGVSVFSSTYYPSTNETVGTDLWTGNSYSSSSSNSYNRSSTETNTITGNTCGICKGRGVDPFAWTDPVDNITSGISMIHTHSGSGRCEYCGKYEWHQHAKCPCPKCSCGM